MKLVSFLNPIPQQQKTYLTADMAASATSSTVENNSGLSTDTLLLLGFVGQEKAEILRVTGTTGATGLSHSSGPLFSHPVRTPIFEMVFNQIEIYRAVGEAGNYSLLTTINLSVDEGETFYIDATGDSTHWYKCRYKNSVTTVVSDYSDPVSGNGYNEKTLRAMTDKVLNAFGDPYGVQISRNQVRSALRDGVKRITRDVISREKSWRTAYNTIDLETGVNIYDFPSRFLGFSRVDINFSADSPGSAKKVESIYSESEYHPSTQFSSSSPQVFIRGEQLVVEPSASILTGGKIYCWGWTYPEEMTTDADTHGLPYGAEELLYSLAMSHIWMTRDQEKAIGFNDAYDKSFPSYLDFLTTSRQSISSKRVNVTFGEDLYSLEDSFL